MIRNSKRTTCADLRDADVDHERVVECADDLKSQQAGDEVREIADRLEVRAGEAELRR